MENVLSYFKFWFAVIGGFITGLLGGWDIALQVLVLFVVFDYITGVLAAWYEKKLNSYVGMRGIAKKIMLFIPVAVAYWLDVVLGMTVLRGLAIFFYVANEGLSIMENLARMGVQIPAPLKATLEQLKEKSENNNAQK